MAKQVVHEQKKPVSNGPGPKDGQTPDMNPMVPIQHPHEKQHRKMQQKDMVHPADQPKD